MLNEWNDNNLFIFRFNNWSIGFSGIAFVCMQIPDCALFIITLFCAHISFILTKGKFFLSWFQITPASLYPTLLFVVLNLSLTDAILTLLLLCLTFSLWGNLSNISPFNYWEIVIRPVANEMKIHECIIVMLSSPWTGNHCGEKRPLYKLKYHRDNTI